MTDSTIAPGASGPGRASAGTNFSSINQQSLTLAIGALAVALPIVMLISSKTPWQSCFRDSISHYYYAPFMGSVFIGALCFVGAYLILYEGYYEGQSERMPSTLAGLAAFGVAFFPTEGTGCEERDFAARTFGEFQYNPETLTHALVARDPTEAYFEMISYAGTLHYVSAIFLFGFLCWFAFKVFPEVQPHQRDADGNLTLAKLRRNRLYKIAGWAMVFSIVALAAGFVFRDSLPWWNPYNMTFWCEAVALWAFGLSWLVKSRVLGDWLDD